MLSVGSNQTDGTLSEATTQISRARDIALQGANSGVLSANSLSALAAEIDQIGQGLIATANAQYLDRPIFGGVTSGRTTYNLDGTFADPGVLGVGSGVVRTIASGATLRIDVEAPDVFGPEDDSVFTHLADLSTALKAGDTTAISAAIDILRADADRVNNAQSQIGARTVRVESARGIATDTTLTLSNSLSEVENTDLAKATVDLQLQEVAYQAALGATSRVLQPSLLDFLR